MAASYVKLARTAPPPPDMRYFAKCWAVAAALVLTSTAGLALDVPKPWVVMLASAGIMLVIVAAFRTVTHLFR